MIDLAKVKAGNKVYIDCDSGFCHGGWELVTRIKIKYDEDTGQQYNVICCDDHEFDSRTGDAITPPLAYGIEDVK